MTERCHLKYAHLMTNLRVTIMINNRCKRRLYWIEQSYEPTTQRRFVG